MAKASVSKLVWVASALGAFLVVKPAQAITGQELVRQCEALERGAVISGEAIRLPKGHDAAACWFYMGAVQDLAATVEEQGGPSVIGSCVPPEITRIELVRALINYARAHRADLGIDGLWHAGGGSDEAAVSRAQGDLGQR